MLQGFTTGLDDEDIREDAWEAIHGKDQTLDNAIKQVNELIRAYEEGTLELLPGRSLEETLEVEVMKVLGKARDKAGEIAGQSLGLQNSAVIMARTGARGSMLNLSQMAGCIGQQAVRGERIQRGYRNRTLSHFMENDKGAEARGFVKASYKTGMAPTEYFFHSMGGREALVDTAVRTSRSGYMQRRLINALEDLKVVSDGSVRNTAGTVIQFCYGEDGVDPSRSEQGENINVDNLISAALGLKYGEVRTITEDMVGYGELEEAPPESEQEMEPDEFENEEE
jgi:DNA-directed RNA polymerase subunit A'